jgi:catalase
VAGGARDRPYDPAGRLQGGVARRYEDQRNDPITNLVDTLGHCRREIQYRLIERFTRRDPGHGARVAAGLRLEAKMMVA